MRKVNNGYTIVAMPKTKKSADTSKVPPSLLIILDGFGLTDPKAKGNAITPETAPHIFEYMQTYPTAKLTAHGTAVGLFRGQEGNSEAGHFAIGAGRRVEQDLVMISRAIKDGTFFKNAAIKQAMQKAKKNHSTLHLLGLLTDGQSAHAYPEHLYSLLKMAYEGGIARVSIHLFTDGRDASPHSAVALLHNLREHMFPGQKIASIMGRLYAMDRNKMWERTEKAYGLITEGKGDCAADDPEKAIMQSYNRGETDEFICPTVIVDDKGNPVSTVQDSDAVIFFNCRSDRARQLTKAFVQKEFETNNAHVFKRKVVLKDILLVAMTEFGPDLPGILTAFPSPDIEQCLAKVIDDHRKQLFISETEKYAHVTYFINGGFPKPINGEDRELVHSSGEMDYAKTPCMKTKEVTDTILAYFKKGTYNFVCVNFPNADMVGHTGNLEAAKLAVSCVDEHVHRLISYIIEQGGAAMITGDHGNAECMIHPKTGELLTEHTTNPVPCIVIGSAIDGKRMKSKGTLSDVAPTLLKLLGIAKPKIMTGKSLF